MFASGRMQMMTAFLGLCCSLAGTFPGEAGERWHNPWRKENGELTEETVRLDRLTVRIRTAAFEDGGTDPVPKPGPGPAVPQPGAGEDGLAMNDRGIDSADVRWRRQARTTGVRMRMLNGPELAFAADNYGSDTEHGWRNRLGVVVPLNPRWELAVLDRLGIYNLDSTGGRAGLEGLTLRLQANPSVSFRPWMSLTPYVGLWDADGYGLGVAGGLSKTWSSGIGLRGTAFAWQPWDEGYDTAVQDGRRHGFEIQGTLPVSRRVLLTGTAGYEWLELGPNAPDGSRYAGRRGNWSVRAQWLALKRDGAYMGYGFRDSDLWGEELVPVELGLFAEISGQRYHRPEGFIILNPTEKSLRERVGLFYSQAVSPHLGFNAEAYVGQDPRRAILLGDLYGAMFRLNILVNPNLRLWGGWAYESESGSMESGGGPTTTFSFGVHWNF